MVSCAWEAQDLIAEAERRGEDLDPEQAERLLCEVETELWTAMNEAGWAVLREALDTREG